MNKFSFKMLGVALCASLLACGSDDDNKVTGGAAEETSIFAMDTVVVTGVSQKGPFVTGSVVTLQELDGITFNQTGNSFKGKIKSDKGDFSVTGINLSSPYAMLEASGYYRDEISGKKSSGTITLNAITDLSNRKTVNINLLTHLEFERVLELVGKKKVSIVKAKAQAEKEIFESFGIDGEFAESEDLNIFKSGDENAALLAVSVLLQSDVDVAGLTERIGNFSIGFAESGTWDDADTKAKIADWACNADLRETLANVRKNIEGWKYADSVPAFEKYVTNFWWDNYGLGTCSKKNDGEVKKNINKLSELYEEYFTCENGRWIIPGEEKSDVKDDEKSSSSKKDDVKSSSSKKEEGAPSSAVAPDEGKSSSSEERNPASSSSVEESSSSIDNPFVVVPSSSSKLPDTIPELPKPLSFLDAFITDYKGYLYFEESNQRVWMTNTYSDIYDSELIALGDTLAFNGFEYRGIVVCDSVNALYEDSSYVFEKNIEDLVYRVYMTKWYFPVSTMHIGDNKGFDMKIVVLKKGTEELPTVDVSSLRFEKDIPDEVSFLEGDRYAPSMISWNDDSLTVFWGLKHNVSCVDGDFRSIGRKVDPNAELEREKFNISLIDSGFVQVGLDTIDVEDGAFSLMFTESGKFYRTIFEKETNLAIYNVKTYTGIGDSYEYHYTCYYFYVDLYVQYKNR